MMTQGLELTDKNPFKDVVVHGIVKETHKERKNVKIIRKWY